MFTVWTLICKFNPRVRPVQPSQYLDENGFPVFTSVLNNHNTRTIYLNNNYKRVTNRPTDQGPARQSAAQASQQTTGRLPTRKVTPQPTNTLKSLNSACKTDLQANQGIAGQELHSENKLASTDYTRQRGREFQLKAPSCDKLRRRGEFLPAFNPEFEEKI